MEGINQIDHASCFLAEAGSRGDAVGWALQRPGGCEAVTLGPVLRGITAPGSPAQAPVPAPPGGWPQPHQPGGSLASVSAASSVKWE